MDLSHKNRDAIWHYPKRESTLVWVFDYLYRIDENLEFPLVTIIFWSNFYLITMYVIILVHFLWGVLAPLTMCLNKSYAQWFSRNISFDNVTSSILWASWSFLLFYFILFLHVIYLKIPWSIGTFLCCSCTFDMYVRYFDIVFFSFFISFSKNWFCPNLWEGEWAEYWVFFLVVSF